MVGVLGGMVARVRVVGEAGWCWRRRRRGREYGR